MEIALDIRLRGVLEHAVRGAPQAMQDELQRLLAAPDEVARLRAECDKLDKQAAMAIALADEAQALSAKVLDENDALRAALERTPCQFWRCEGDEKEPEDMVTCFRCRTLYETRQAALKGE